MAAQNRLVRTLRCKTRRKAGNIGLLTTAIGSTGAIIGEIRTVLLGTLYSIRDIEVVVDSPEHLEKVKGAIAQQTPTEVLEVIDEVRKVHSGGKIDVRSRYPVRSLADLRLVYTPGVAEICRAIASDPSKSILYTAIPRTVAIVTDGSAILGLGNIGAVAGMPVMEGKAALLEQMVGLSGVPILVDSNDPDEIVRTVKMIAPTFGAIQLEDIAAPACFEIIEKLTEALEMPVFHDDQHGTATVVRAAALIAVRRVGLEPRRATIGQIGLGAAGTVIAQFLSQFSEKPILGADLSEAARQRHERTGGKSSTIDEIMREADMVVTTTGVPGLIKPEMVRPGQIILSLSNPNPEIEPETALAHGAAYALDGKAVNNLLAFPGLLRGSLDSCARRINREMYFAAANAISDHAREHDEAVPDPLDRTLHRSVTHAVARAAMESGVARKHLDEDYFSGGSGE